MTATAAWSGARSRSTVEGLKLAALSFGKDVAKAVVRRLMTCSSPVSRAYGSLPGGFGFFGTPARLGYGFTVIREGTPGNRRESRLQGVTFRPIRANLMSGEL